jgi:ABC-2 type transport system permease protein
MKALLVARRDLAAYLNGFSAWVIIAAILFAHGILFHTQVLERGAMLSHDALRGFLYLAFGFTAITALLLTMRSLAEERANGTDVLLQTSPISERQVVLGKYLAAMAMIGLFLACSLYMPALIFVNGKVALLHIVAGYTGVLFVGSAVASIGIFSSSLFKSQVASVIVSGTITLAFVAAWMLADRVDAPLGDLLEWVSLYDQHFRPFEKGELTTTSLVYYGSLTWVFLLLATKVLEGRRWR